MRNRIIMLVLLAFVAPAVAQAPNAAPVDTQAGETTNEVATTETVAAEQTPESYNLLTTKKLTGDWFGSRPVIEDAGITLSPLLVATYQFNLRGGQNTHNAHESAGKAFYNLEFDFDKMFGLKGASFFSRGVQTWNSGVGRHVGSLTPPYWSAGSSGDNSFELTRWWWRQRLFDDRLEFRLGKMLNVVDLFDQNVYAKAYTVTFQNRALNHNMTIPTTLGLGAFVKAWPLDWLYVQAMAIDPDYSQTTCSHGFGGFDTAFGGEDRFRGLWEFGVLPHEIPGVDLLPGHYRFGLWLDPQAKTKFINDLGGQLAPRARSDDVGWYLNVDQMVWKENDEPKDNQGLGLFARYGFAHPDVNMINHFWSAGASYQGLIPSRDEDVLGFGVAQSILSKTYRHNVNSLADRETVYEVYYAIQLTPWCVITPDVQVITNPGGDKDARDALVGGVRVKIAF